jgi:protein phosphatase PTC1
MYVYLQDHKPTDGDERKRIEEAGGFILRSRVLGMLAVTRSFGDHNLKKFVTARPFTSERILDENSSFLIIACDGLWDVVSDQEAVNFVNEQLDNGVDFSNIAPQLLETALAKGSTDNVTIMVVLL